MERHSILLNLILVVLSCTISHQISRDPNVPVHQMGLAIKRNFHPGKPPIAVGSRTFLEFVRDSNIFVDKTLLMQEIIDDWIGYELITCPSRWGKSINLDMIKTFVETIVDENGTYIVPNMTANYRLFMYGEVTLQDGQVERLATPLLISQHVEIVDEFLGKKPVVYLNLQNIQGSTFWELVRHLVAKIRKAFHSHHYMLKVFETLIQEDRDLNLTRITIKRYVQFRKILNNEENLNRREVQNAIPLLCQILHRYFHSKVFLLVDEYLAPLHRVYSNVNFPAFDKERFVTFYCDFLGILISENQHIEKALVTSLYPLTEELRIYQISSLTPYTFLVGDKMPYYGFQPWEMTTLFNYLNIPNSTLEQLNSYYGGYQFEDFTICDPWPIVNYLADNQIKTWINTDEITNYVNHMLRNEVFNIYFFLLYVNENRTSIPVSRKAERLTLAEFELLIRATKAPYDDPFLKKALIFENKTLRLSDVLDSTEFGHKAIMFLYTHGYLSLDGTVEHTHLHCFMICPNLEVRNFMKELYYKTNTTVHIRFPEMTRAPDEPFETDIPPFF